MSSDNFETCCVFVRKFEGGNSDVAGDRGGRTGRGGITYKTYNAYRDRKGLPRQDVFKISDAEINEIYRMEYWNPVRGGQVPAGEDLVLFDYAINSGPARANRADRAARAAGNAGTAAFIHKICAGRVTFMRALGSWRQFGKGWGRRVAACEATALRMAGALTPEVAAGAKKQHDAKRRRAPQIGTAGTGAVAGAEQFGFDSWAIAAIIAAIAIGVFIAMFNASRQRARSDALSAAVKDMQAAQTAAEAAKQSALAEAAAKAQAIAAEQTALDAAKAKIGGAAETAQNHVTPPAAPEAKPPRSTE